MLKCPSYDVEEMRDALVIASNSLIELLNGRLSLFNEIEDNTSTF